MTDRDRFEGHTPGPWRVHSDGDCIVSEVPNQHSNLNPVVAFIEVDRVRNGSVPIDADAALIAAAPDLLRERDEAVVLLRSLSRIAWRDHKHLDVGRSCVHCDARALLARIDGEG